MTIDTSFPKQQVESLKPSSTALYENQMASESIKNAIGISSSPSAPAAVSDKRLPVNTQHPVLPSGPTSQPKSVKQLRTKLPPPSTKVLINGPLYSRLWHIIQRACLNSQILWACLNAQIQWARLNAQIQWVCLNARWACPNTNQHSLSVAYPAFSWSVLVNTH